MDAAPAAAGSAAGRLTDLTVVIPTEGSGQKAAVAPTARGARRRDIPFCGPPPSGRDPPGQRLEFTDVDYIDVEL